MESARLPNGMMDGAAGGGGGGMPKGKPKGALPATPGCPLPGTAPGIIEGGVCWLGNGEGPRNKENEEVGRVKSYTSSSFTNHQLATPPFPGTGICGKFLE